MPNILRHCTAFEIFGNFSPSSIAPCSRRLVYVATVLQKNLKTQRWLIPEGCSSAPLWDELPLPKSHTVKKSQVILTGEVITGCCKNLTKPILNTFWADCRDHQC